MSFTSLGSRRELRMPEDVEKLINDALRPPRMDDDDDAISMSDFHVPAFDASSDTSLVHAPAIVEPPAAPAVEVKRCNVCGADVAGHRRYKDHHGYWCVECHRADAQRRHRVPRIRCTSCRRSIPESAGMPDAGGVLCSRCHTEREEDRARDRQLLAQLAKQRRARRMVYVQVGITTAVVIAAIVCHHAGLFGIREHARGNETRDLMDGARVMGLTFVAMIAALVWWLKRQV